MVSKAVRIWGFGLNPCNRAPSKPAGTIKIIARLANIAGSRKYTRNALRDGHAFTA
jgi:hypothetical protein